ncbi:MAG: glycosyl transferase group 1 [Candidatus Omnitrophica bacterium CG11_big_fil_rev_8_21_14_0_20_64_10]|nr:MAG: glycosyl transferase group 1 [Candidatus Omnitrophica bacterium CG11_big_fil_rev_8_21_14_0_20_64_10]
MYGEGDPIAAESFERLLEAERPDAVHLHAFTAAVSIRLVRAASSRGIPILFTYHTPTASCQRGTLMRWGRQVCDGRLRRTLCTACTLEGKGMPRWLAGGAARLPTAFGELLGSMGLAGGGWTALRMRGLVERRHRAFEELVRTAAGVVAVSDWIRTLLLDNGVPSGKIFLCRQGLPQNRSSGTVSRPPLPPAWNSARPLRIVCLGRFDPVKGQDLLIAALHRSPELPVTIDLYGAVQSPSEERYRERLRRAAGADPRIQIREMIPPESVPERLAAYDLLAVPSRWLEAGPLVILEAFAAGLPVLGARLGGISERIEPGVNGLLLEPDAPAAWAETLRTLCASPGRLAILQSGVRFPEGMERTAEVMERLYRRLTEGR